MVHPKGWTAYWMVHERFVGIGQFVWPLTGITQNYLHQKPALEPFVAKRRSPELRASYKDVLFTASSSLKLLLNSLRSSPHFRRFSLPREVAAKGKFIPAGGTNFRLNQLLIYGWFFY